MSTPDEVGQPGPDVHVHPQALVESAGIGAGSRVWAFAHILPGAVVGTDANICDHVFIEGDVVVGDRVTIKSGVQLWDGLRVEDDVFIGPNATFTNDPMPRSKQHLERYATTTLRRGCSIGANAVVLPGVTVRRRSSAPERSSRTTFRRSRSSTATRRGSAVTSTPSASRVRWRRMRPQARAIRSTASRRCASSRCR
jgi:UDP-3-O-[3-hydroxymyristoyl] glucosamine N-acyltransferase